MSDKGKWFTFIGKSDHQFTNGEDYMCVVNDYKNNMNAFEYSPGNSNGWFGNNDKYFKLKENQFVVSNKWQFKITEDNYKKFKHLRDLTEPKGYITSIPYYNLSWGIWRKEKSEDLIEITFEQFEKYILNKDQMQEITHNPVKGEQFYCTNDVVMDHNDVIAYVKGKTYPCEMNGNITDEQGDKKHIFSYSGNCNINDYFKLVNKETMNKKIIRYKSKTPEFAHSFEKIMNHNLSDEVNFMNKSISCEKARDLGVLDIWFDPVYEDEKIKLGEHVVEIFDNYNIKVGCTTYSKTQLQEAINTLELPNISEATKQGLCAGLHFSDGTVITLNKLQQILKQLS